MDLFEYKCPKCRQEFIDNVGKAVNKIREERRKDEQGNN